MRGFPDRGRHSGRPPTPSTSRPAAIWRTFDRFATALANLNSISNGSKRQTVTRLSSRNFGMRWPALPRSGNRHGHPERAARHRGHEDRRDAGLNPGDQGGSSLPLAKAIATAELWKQGALTRIQTKLDALLAKDVDRQRQHDGGAARRDGRRRPGRRRGRHSRARSRRWAAFRAGEMLHGWASADPELVRFGARDT